MSNTYQIYKDDELEIDLYESGCRFNIDISKLVFKDSEVASKRLTG